MAEIERLRAVSQSQSDGDGQGIYVGAGNDQVVVVGQAGGVGQAAEPGVDPEENDVFRFIRVIEALKTERTQARIPEPR